jgi:hypothetical protein
MSHNTNDTTKTNVGSNAQPTTRPIPEKARELLNSQAGDWVGSPNPETPKGPELVLWLMILMLPVKFAWILFGR